MRVPGDNLLRLALGAIQPQEVGYYAWLSRTPDPAGKLVDNFAMRATLSGSMQPVSRERVQSMGLDHSKSYAIVYAMAVANPVSRDRGADQFDYDGRLYAVHGNVNWFAQDGWQGVLLVDVGAAP